MAAVARVDKLHAHFDMDSGRDFCQLLSIWLRQRTSCVHIVSPPGEFRSFVSFLLVFRSGQHKSSTEVLTYIFAILGCWMISDQMKALKSDVVDQAEYILYHLLLMSKR